MDTPPRPVALRWILLVATWAALAAGLLQGPLQVLKRFVQPISFFNPQTWWMGSVSSVVFYIPLALVIWVLCRMLPRILTQRIVVFLFAFLAVWGMAGIFGRQISQTAMLLLALGLSVQIARMVAKRLDASTRFFRRSVGWLAAAVVGIALGINAARAVVERHELRTIPAARSGAPNVLLIVLDAVRASDLSLYGYARATTPNLERLAATGVHFERAFSTAPWTLPSHAGMFTGRPVHQLTADWGVPLDRSRRTLGEVLRARGYATAGIVGNYFYASRETGLNRGFVRYEDYPVTLTHVLRNSALGHLLVGSRSPYMRLRRPDRDPARKTAEDVNAGVLRWIERTEGHPFFVFVNYYDAHDPYEPPRPYRGRYETAVTDAADTSEAARERRRAQRLIDRYDEAITYLDERVGGLLAELERRGKLANTLVIVTADHGEEFGEHGVYEHGKSLYHPSLRVPLVVAFPSRVPAGVTVAAPVSLQDLAATILDLTAAGGERLPGRSLARFWRAGADSLAVDTLLAEVGQGFDLPARSPALKGKMHSLFVGRLQYIRRGDGEEEIYDYESDPWEQHDLAPSQDPSPFRRHLEAILAPREAPPR